MSLGLTGGYKHHPPRPQPVCPSFSSTAVFLLLHKPAAPSHKKCNEQSGWKRLGMEQAASHVSLRSPRGRRPNEPSPQGPSPGHRCREGKRGALQESGRGLLAFLSERTFPSACPSWRRGCSGSLEFRSPNEVALGIGGDYHPRNRATGGGSSGRGKALKMSPGLMFQGTRCDHPRSLTIGSERRLVVAAAFWGWGGGVEWRQVYWPSWQDSSQWWK